MRCPIPKKMGFHCKLDCIVHSSKRVSRVEGIFSESRHIPTYKYIINYSTHANAKSIIMF